MAGQYLQKIWYSKTTHGHIHNYPGMTFDLYDKNKVKIDMIDYMNVIIDDVYIKYRQNYTSPDPTTGELFAVNNSEEMIKEKAQ